jgi:hypothetical protein
MEGGGAVNSGRRFIIDVKLFLNFQWFQALKTEFGI